MAKKEKVRLPDDQVVLKVSVCGKCNDAVRFAVAHMMDKDSKKEFLDEVLQYNLSVKEMSLIDYRKEKPEFCKCK